MTLGRVVYVTCIVVANFIQSLTILIIQQDESSTLRKQMTGGMISELKGQLLHCIYETEWRRSVLKGESSSGPVAGNVPALTCFYPSNPPHF